MVGRPARPGPRDCASTGSYTRPVASPLAEAFRYNRWANERLLAACRALSDDLLDVAVPGTYGSTRRTLLHLVGGQQTFVLRTHGRQHEGEFSASSPWPGFDALERVADESSNALIAIAESLVGDEQITLPWQGTDYRFPRVFFLVHALEHGIEHRAQVVVTFAQLGLPAPDLDAWAYAEYAGYGLPVSE